MGRLLTYDKRMGACVRRMRDELAFGGLHWAITYMYIYTHHWSLISKPHSTD